MVLCAKRGSSQSDLKEFPIAQSSSGVQLKQLLLVDFDHSFVRVN